MTNGPAPIQIWRPDGDRWVRPAVGPFGDHYSAVPSIHRRHDSEKRVVLIGESVAAGYLYAPHYTPAKELARALPTWDVVDLARTNESLATLQQTAHAVMQLEPDVVVMWAGNNWMLRDLGGLSPYHPNATHRVDLGRTLREGGLGAVSDATSRWVRPPVLAALADIHDAVTSTGARLVVVIPEVNLIDWEHAQPVSVLPDGSESAWYRALAVGDHTRMTLLDGGSSSVTARLAASAEDAIDIDTLRLEVDASSGPLRGTTSSPMATRQIQGLLREWTHDENLPTVDIPLLIEASGGRPDRTWFLDYCHHTAKAISEIVGSIAEHIDAGNMRAGDQAMPGELEAVAALGALMHTDHRLVTAGDRRPLLRHWRDQAKQAWPQAHELMRDLIDSRLGTTPVPLSTAQRRNRQRPYPFGFAHGWRPHTTESDALEVLGLTPADAEALCLPVERAWPGTQMFRPGQRRWDEEQPFNEQPCYFRSVVPRSRLGVAIRTGVAPQVELTARAPQGGRIAVELGGWRTELDVGARWTSHRFTIPADAASPGVRSLQITWPELPEGPERWQAALADLAANDVPQLHAVFGEVFSLKVT